MSLASASLQQKQTLTILACDPMCETPINPSAGYEGGGSFSSHTFIWLGEKRIASGGGSEGTEEPSDNILITQNGPIVPTRVAEDVFVLSYVDFASVRRDAPRFQLSIPLRV